VNPVEHRGDAPRERVTLSAEQKQQGFAAVTERLKRRSDEDRDRLLEQANAAVHGYAAYREGEKCLAMRQYVVAVLWLQFAASRGIPGAAEALATAERWASSRGVPISREVRARFAKFAEQVLATSDRAVLPEQEPSPPFARRPPGVPGFVGRRGAARPPARKGVPDRRC
jgi:hypothetical protein